jgi:dTDP-4-dehydrorhamnose reductase
MMERLANGSGISAPDDQLFVPTFIDDIAGAVDVLLEKQASGIYHIVGSTPISPFGAAKEIAAVFGFDAKLVTPTTFTSYFAGRAPVPQKAVLSGEKAKKLGIVMHGFADGLREVQKQEKV